MASQYEIAGMLGGLVLAQIIRPKTSLASTPNLAMVPVTWHHCLA